MDTYSILWRRLDTPGHDACRFENRESGWKIAGTAVFRHKDGPAELAYYVDGDPAWRTRRAWVRGFVGAAVIDVAIERTANGKWSLNGHVAPGLAAQDHLDFGFTPATNFQQLRQLALSEGQEADLSVAWLDVPPGVLQVLAQHYERRSETTYWYSAPAVGYAALLELTRDGIIRKYPGLWELEE